MEATATATATGLLVTYPDGSTIEFPGKRAMAAAAVVVGQWDAAHGGLWNTSVHATHAAARKAADARRHQAGVRVVPVA